MYNLVLDGIVRSKDGVSDTRGERFGMGQVKLNCDCGSTMLVGVIRFTRSIIGLASTLEFVGSWCGTAQTLGTGGAAVSGCCASCASPTRRAFVFSAEGVNSSSSELLDSSGASARFSLCVSVASLVRNRIAYRLSSLLALC